MAYIQDSAGAEITVGEVVCSIMPRFAKDRSLPTWPPDCFAVCATLLSRSGAYSQLLQKWPPGRYKTLSGWVEQTRRLGERWRAAWDAEQPAELSVLRDHWRVLTNALDLPISHVDRRLSESLMLMTAVADEASEGVGCRIFIPNLDSWCWLRAI
jgi:hypothetical protein